MRSGFSVERHLQTASASTAMYSCVLRGPCSGKPAEPGRLQVWMAVIARCLLHVVYEFQAFLNLFAKQSLGLSSGMAAQVSWGQRLHQTPATCIHYHLQSSLLAGVSMIHMASGICSCHTHQKSC
jgi:hypothetical protein